MKLFKNLTIFFTEFELILQVKKGKIQKIGWDSCLPEGVRNFNPLICIGKQSHRDHTFFSQG